MIPNKPCLIEEHVTQSWPCRQEWITNAGHVNFDHLLSLFADDDVPVSDCACQYFNSQKSGEMKFAEFVKYWIKLISDKHDYEKNPCYYLKDWHFFLEHPDRPVYKVPLFFESDWLNQHWLKDMAIHEPINDYRFVYMGPKGSSTPLHKDVYSSYSWSANICGEKEWILIAPDREDILRRKYSQSGRELPYDIRGLLSVPEFIQDIEPIVVKQTSGQVMFVPSDWIHQVRNTADTISINHNWFNACNIFFIWKGLLKALKEVQTQISDLKEHNQQWANECQNLLRIHHGLNFQDFVEILQTKVQSLEIESQSFTDSLQGKQVPDPLSTDTTIGSCEETTIDPCSSPGSSLLFRFRHEVQILIKFLPLLQQELDKESGYSAFSCQTAIMGNKVSSL